MSVQFGEIGRKTQLHSETPHRALTNRQTLRVSWSKTSSVLRVIPDFNQSRSEYYIFNKIFNKRKFVIISAEKNI